LKVKIFKINYDKFYESLLNENWINMAYEASQNNKNKKMKLLKIPS
jgi:hypothetical protein